MCYVYLWQKFIVYPELRSSILLDRTEQFETRLSWDLTVDATGEERSEWDNAHAFYFF